MSNAAGSVTIVLSADQTSFSASLTEAQRNLDKFAGKAKAAGHGTVSGMQAASASIRLLENPLGNNMRAIERLISQSKILSGVMKAAFPLVGAIAIGGMIAKLGKEVYEFVEKVNAMPKAITDAFNGLALSARTTNDQLDLTNAKLEQEINKLQGKPQNNLKVALYEARVEADQLAASLASDAKAVNEVLNANSISGLGTLLGKAPTSSVSSSIQVYMNDLQALGNKLSETTDPAAAAAIQKQIDAKRTSGLGWAKSKLFVLDNPQFAGPDDDVLGGADNGANRADVLGFQGVMLRQQHHEQSKAENKDLTGQKGQAEAAKAAADAAKKAAAEALAARKKAAEEQLKEWEDENGDWKAEEDRSLRQDAAWWQAKLDTLSTSSLNYRAVNKKVNADIIADNRQWAGQVADFTKSYLGDGDKRSWVSAADTAEIDKQGKAALEWIAALRAGVDLQQQLADGQKESSIQMALATGQVTRLDAAQRMADLHAAQYQAQMAALADSRKMVEENGSLSELERRAQLAQLDNQVTAANGRRATQTAEDNNSANPQGTLASTGFVDALDEFVIASKDAAGQMRELVSGSLRSINEELVKAMTGQRTDFRGAGAGILRGATGTILQKAEGGVLGALGFGTGKPDGSKSKPLYVKIADAVSDTTSGVANSALQKAGGFLQSFLHIPGFAGGGAVSPGTLAMVGENGPELAYFGNGAHITPNHQLSMVGAGAGGASPNYNVQVANGVTPEQMRMHVRAALQEFHPQVVASSVSAMQSLRGRTTMASR